MAHNAFDTAREVLDDGFTGQAAVDEWFSRVSARGERFCPIAYEQLLSTGGAVDVGGDSGGTGADAGPSALLQSFAADVAANRGNVGGGSSAPVELFPGMLSYPGVPGDPLIQSLEDEAGI